MQKTTPNTQNDLMEIIKIWNEWILQGEAREMKLMDQKGVARGVIIGRYGIDSKFTSFVSGETHK